MCGILSLLLLKKVSTFGRPMCRRLAEPLAYYDRGRKELRELTQKRINSCGWLKDKLGKMGIHPDFGSIAIDEQLLQSVADPIDTCTVFAYLLTLTTKLRHLNACFFQQRGWWMNAPELFASLARQQGITSLAPLFLPELDKLEVFHWNVSDDTSSEMLYVLLPFLAWTGLKRLECNRLQSDDPLFGDLDTAQSQVEEMALSKCYVDAPSLGEMIWQMPLRVFRYEHTEFDITIWRVRPRALLRALKRHVGSTLEELVLVVDEGTSTSDMRTLLDFRGLRTLKRLVLDVDGLFSTEEENLDRVDDGYETTEEDLEEEHDALWTSEDRARLRDGKADSADGTSEVEVEDEEDTDPRSVFKMLLRMLPESLEGLLIRLEGLHEGTYDAFAEILKNVQSTRLKNLTEFRYTLDFIGYSYELDSDPFADEMTLPSAAASDIETPQQAADQ